jgi:hypothetical protein
VGVFKLKEKEKYNAKITNKTAPTNIGPEASKRRQSTAATGITPEIPKLRQSTEAAEAAPEIPSSAGPVKASR